MHENELRELVESGKLRITEEGVLIRVGRTPPMIGSIYVPEMARESTLVGEVLQNNTSLNLEPGSFVLYENYKGHALDSRVQDLWILEKDHILATVEKGAQDA